MIINVFEHQIGILEIIKIDKWIVWPDDHCDLNVLVQSGTSSQS